MSPQASPLQRPSARPLRVFGLILVLAFSVEGAIMLALPVLTKGVRSAIVEAVIDPLTLTVVMAPALWFIIVRPLQRLYASRGQLLSQLFHAQEEERARLARDLHDELGQHLTAILVGLKTIEQAQDLAQASERARGAAGAAAAGLDKLRRISRGLRPTVLEDLGLAPAIERLCDEHKAAFSVPVSLTVDLAPGQRFTPDTEVCLFRVLQESLTNSARHSGAKAVRVTLARRAQGVTLVVEDDGKGFDAAKSGGASFGLHSMRERVELLDGTLSVRSSPGAGTTISVFIPGPTT